MFMTAVLPDFISVHLKRLPAIGTHFQVNGFWVLLHFISMDFPVSSPTLLGAEALRSSCRCLLYLSPAICTCFMRQYFLPDLFIDRKIREILLAAYPPRGGIRNSHILRNLPVPHTVLSEEPNLLLCFFHHLLLLLPDGNQIIARSLSFSQASTFRTSTRVTRSVIFGCIIMPSSLFGSLSITLNWSHSKRYLAISSLYIRAPKAIRDAMLAALYLSLGTHYIFSDAAKLYIERNLN